MAFQPSILGIPPISFTVEMGFVKIGLKIPMAGTFKNASFNIKFC
jgi:hypothetical protein